MIILLARRENILYCMLLMFCEKCLSVITLEHCIRSVSVERTVVTCGVPLCYSVNKGVSVITVSTQLNSDVFEHSTNFKLRVAICTSYRSVFLKSIENLRTA
jgi:hypothetical protein